MADTQHEVDRNYEAFTAMLPSLLAEHRDKFALMKDQKIISFFTSAEDARVAANAFIADKIYSIQRVSSSAIDLGFYTHAIPIS